MEDVLTDTPPALRDAGLISIGDVGRALNISKYGAYRLIQRIKPRKVGIGRKIYVYRVDIFNAIKKGGLTPGKRGRKPKAAGKSGTHKRRT